MVKAVILVFFILSFSGVNARAGDVSLAYRQTRKEAEGMNFEVDNFTHNQAVPSQYTCDGENISPAISWGNLPDGTKSLALSVIDPDAPMGDFVHWLVYDISPEAEVIPKGGPLPDGAKELQNGFGRTQYAGPCPPSGEHRYFFTLYALDTACLEGATASNFLALLRQHTIESSEVIGLYKRK